MSKLPGVGESSAQKKIEEREKRKLEKAEDIMRTKGIGKKKFEKIKENIIVK